MQTHRMKGEMTPDAGAPPLAVAAIAVACLSAVATAVAWSDGGHLSLDAVQQMVEAATGRSVSWSPPFMSALLQALGGDAPFSASVASGHFVLLACIGLWGGLLLAALPVARVRGLWLRVLLVSVLALHPVLLAYAGIVWKDVLLAAIVSAALGLSLASLSSKATIQRVVLAALAMGLVAILPQVRQHGMLLAPLLGLLPLASVFWMDTLRYRWRFLLLALLMAVAAVTAAKTSSWAAAAISEDDSDSTSVGFRSVFMFDIAGIESRVDIGPVRALGLDTGGDEALRQVYSPDRIDSLPQATGFDAIVAPMPVAELRQLWWTAVTRHPRAYVEHRVAVFQRMLGLGDGGVCLPVHLGVAGPPEQLAALGLVEAIDGRDARVYAQLQPLFGTPVFSQAWVLAILFAVALRVAFLPRRSRIAMGVLALATLGYYASFMMVGIACDFRYLFAGLVMTLLLAAALLMGWREAGETRAVEAG